MLAIGAKIGRLLVVAQAEKIGGRRAWLCLCDCGNEKAIQEKQMVRGYVRSCGCLKSELARKRLTTHGGSLSRLHNIWGAMKQRCFYKKSHSYAGYGGRGITVCDEWKDDFAAFRDWAIRNGYKEDLTIDRIDVNGNYCPENCRWVSLQDQARNKRDTVTYKGKLAKEWAEEFGIKNRDVYRYIASVGDLRTFVSICKAVQEHTIEQTRR